MQTETVFLDFREFPFFLFAFIAGIMLVDSHFAAFSLYPQRLFYSADIGGSDAFVRIQDISPCSHIVKQSAARKSDEIAPHPSAFNFFSCRKFFPHIEMGFGIVYEILTLSDLPARGGRGRSVVGVRPLLRPVCGHRTHRCLSAAQRVARGSAVCARAAARGSILTALSRLRHGHLSMQKPRDLRGAFYAATHILCVTCSVRGWS